MYVSTFALLSSAFAHMLQPLAVMALLCLLVFTLPNRARAYRAARAFIAGVGAMYGVQLVTGLLTPVWLSPLYSLLVVFTLIMLVCLGLWLASHYARAQEVALSEHVLRPITWLEQKRASRQVSTWLIFSGGVIVGLVEPLFYGFQQQLLTAEIQTSLSIQALFLTLMHLAVTLAPLVLITWIAGQLPRLVKTDRLSGSIRAVLPLVGSGLLILLGWIVFLAAHSFV